MTYRNTDRLLMNLLVRSLGSVTHARRLIMRASPLRDRSSTMWSDPKTRRIAYARAAIIESTGAAIEFTDDGVKCIIVLGKGARWKEDHIEIMGQSFPATITQGIVGCPVTDILDHPSLSPDMIVISAMLSADGTLRMTLDNTRIDAGTLSPTIDDRKRDAMRRLNDVGPSISRFYGDFQTRKAMERSSPYKYLGALIVTILLMIPLFIFMGAAMVGCLITGGYSLFGTLPIFALMVGMVVVLIDIRTNYALTQVYWAPSRVDRLNEAVTNAKVNAGHLYDYGSMA